MEKTSALKTYAEDLEIAEAIVRRDEGVTKRYFYQQCYPLFKAVYDNYDTDCTCVKEFIDEIYVAILTPGKTTGKCQLENYRGESTLTSWLKSVCLFYCYGQHELKLRMPVHEAIADRSEKDDEESDRKEAIYGSVEIDLSDLNRQDAVTLLQQMPNRRYRDLIRLRYLEQKTNEETAKELGMSMDNYYNKHKAAKAQFMNVCRKEERHA